MTHTTHTVFTHPCRHKYKNNILLLIILLFQTNHTTVQTHSIPALLCIFRCKKPQYLKHAEQSESFWRKSEQEMLVSETVLWESRRYCCGVGKGDDDNDDDDDDDDDDTSLVSETALFWEPGLLLWNDRGWWWWWWWWSWRRYTS